MSISRSSLCLVLIAGAALFAGCEASVSTGDNDLNTDDSEKLIKEKYPAQADGLKLTEIECGTTEAKVGNTFTCTATNTAGVHLDIEGTIDSVDEDTDKAHFTTKTTKTVSDGTIYAENAVKVLQGQGYAVDSMDCPDILIKTGTKVECDMTMDNGSKQTATLTLTDGNGKFDVDTSGPLGGNS